MTNRKGFVAVRCPNCGRLLYTVKGLAEVETVCPRCGEKVAWPCLEPRRRTEDCLDKTPQFRYNEIA